MGLKIKTPPAIEPISLLEIKQHLRIDSGSMADNLSEIQTILSGDHIVAAEYSLIGTDVEVSGYDTIVILTAGTFGAGGTVDVKIQESDVGGGTDYTDVTDGTFAQVTTENDETVYELAYSGTKKYIRAVATVAVNTCDFGVVVVRSLPIGTEDTLLLAFITTAREWCEDYQNRVYITQTWEWALDKFPQEKIIKVPLPPLKSIVSIKYYDTDEKEHDFSSDNYLEDLISNQGRISLAYNKSWPTTILRPINGVIITFEAGYGDVGSDVPKKTKQAIKALVGELNEHREATDVKELKIIPFAVYSLLNFNRIWPL